MVGGHSRGFDQFPWFDDDVAASLRPATARLRQIRYDTWAEFHWDVSLPKAAVNYWEERNSGSRPSVPTSAHESAAGASRSQKSRLNRGYYRDCVQSDSNIMKHTKTSG